MVYAGDQWVQFPVKDLYDTQMMAIAINAAKDMYDKGQQEMKEFNKLYGDFTTPILADQDWYNRNVTGRLRDAINEVYRQGGDPLRNPQARAFLSQVINNMPIGEIAKLRTSADNAREFLKAKQRLQLEGKWNPLYEKYDGPSMDTYSTVGPNGQGIWGRISPTPVEDVATFSNPYFEGMKPNVHRESRNGIDYEVEQITDEDLKAIADAHHNELVSTPQGQMMYKYYQDVARSNGSTDVDKDARDMFNAAIADSQRRRTYRKDNYNDNYYKAEDLKLKRSSNALAWQKFYWDKEKDQQELDIKALKASGDTGGTGTSLSGMPLAQMWYDKGIANSLSAGGITLTWDQVHNNYGSYSKEIYDQAAKFGKKAIGGTPAKEPTNEDLLNTDYAKKHGNLVKTALNHPQEKRPPRLQNAIEEARKEWISKNSTGVVPTNEVKEKFKSQYTITMDSSQVAKAIGDTVSGNDRVVQASVANVEKLFGENDVVTGTAGYTRAHEGNDTKELRDAIEKYGAKNTRITPMGDGYASLRKTGKFEVMPRVRVQVVDDSGEIKYDNAAYYNIGVSGQGNKQGAYIGDNRKVRMHDKNEAAIKKELQDTSIKLVNILYLHSDDTGNVDPKYKDEFLKLKAKQEQLKNLATIYDENFVDEHYEGDYSLYPDYDNWFLLGDWARHDISQMK